MNNQITIMGESTAVKVKKNLRTALFLIFVLVTSVSQAQFPPYIQITMTPDKDSWTGQVGKNKSVTIQVLRNYIPLDGYEVTYTITPEGKPMEKTGAVYLKNKTAIIPVGTLKTPGYKTCEVAVNIDGTLYKNTMGITYYNRRGAKKTNNPSVKPDYQVLMMPANDSWDTEVGKNKDITVQVVKDYVSLRNLKVSYSIYEEGMPVEKEGTLLLKNKSVTIPVGTLNKPGYKTCKVSVQAGDTLLTNMMTIAYSADKIEPTVKDPADFDEFWQKAIERVRNTKEIVEIKPIERLSTKYVDVSLIKLSDPFSNLTFYGYLSKPKREGKFPVVLFVPAAGVKPPLSRTNFINKDAITLSLEIHGVNPELEKEVFDKYKKVITGYPFVGVENRESYYFYNGILKCIKAADYLTSLNEFDGKNFAVFGGSQGGYLSIATAALHEKVSCLVAFHPAMSDVTGYLHNRVGGWPHLFRKNRLGEFDKDKAVETISYYDTVNFAKRLTVPCYYSFGYNDVTCPATTSSAVLNSIKSPVTLFITPITGHWRIPEMMTRSVKWLLDEQLIK